MPGHDCVLAMKHREVLISFIILQDARQVIYFPILAAVVRAVQTTDKNEFFIHFYIAKRDTRRQRAFRGF